MPNSRADAGRRGTTVRDSQLDLLPTRVSTILPGYTNGKHIKFRCIGVDGEIYHCKADADGRSIRATEWFSHRLAQHLGIAVPEFRVVEHEGETYFGSRQVSSTADTFAVRDFLARRQLDELGRATEWLGRRLTGIYVFDMFLNNPDRALVNFVFEREGQSDKLCVIDFADARLEDLATCRFPFAGSNTVDKGKFLRSVHGFHLDPALEMIKKIGAVPASEIGGILGGMPDDWLSDDEKDSLGGVWAGPEFESRLSALRAGLEDGSRL